MSTPPQDLSAVDGHEQEEELRTQVRAREQELIAALLVDPSELEAVAWLASARMLDEPSRAILDDLRSGSRPEDIARGQVDLPGISDRLALLGIDVEPEELAQLRDGAVAAVPGSAADAARAAQDALIRLDLVDAGLMQARWAVPAPPQVQQVPQLREQALAIVAEAEAVMDSGADPYPGAHPERDPYEPDPYERNPYERNPYERNPYEVPEPMYSHDLDHRWEREEDYGRQPWALGGPEQEGWQR